MGTFDDAQEKAVDAVRTRGEQLDEVLGNVGSALEDKVAPVAERVTEKFFEKSEGSRTAQ